MGAPLYLGGDELDATVTTLAAEIVANSWGTNRIDKRPFAPRGDEPSPRGLAARAISSVRVAR